MVKVWRAPFGYVVLIWRKKDKWFGFRRASDLRRIYEFLARRGVPRALSAPALAKADPSQARLHKFDV